MVKVLESTQCTPDQERNETETTQLKTNGGKLYVRQPMFRSNFQSVEQ